MSTNQNPSSNSIAAPIEIGPDGLARESPIIAYTEKIIEDEQLQLRKYIEENYSKIRDVERELANLSMEMKLTAGPKKAALEHLRKKIEMSTERIRLAKVKEEQAKKAWEAAAKEVQDEEASKQKLCDDLNNLVQESSNSQLARLEELKRRMESLNPSRSSNTHTPFAGNQRLPQSSTVEVSSAGEPPCGATGTISTEVKAENSAVTEQNQQPSSDSEGRRKKRSSNKGRGSGIGAVPKGRKHAVPDWTGAGFDVDGRG
ncbi:uncharacterized protein LOC121804980 [Salvia splendens]|uniref:uncharacterized protein LOC121804980 n=1 Tax=Salvia splendens TaxID=180675 RepID=UPI001C252EA5|nr:uncharacterized protein LOC121804980 [Salvia splendens]